MGPRDQARNGMQSLARQTGDRRKRKEGGRESEREEEGQWWEGFFLFP